ncbi:CYFA0S01e18272g1_1 [Cyberlindnera fabianii]|uniref:CYFA0S01e18272g1_1 n=1 Tax=Cyberlindnera fabianii TaxID=36022 RepID=A0A061AT02_CYBFA|nr:CYFA0S01e18272g1_1 [Cyberlindnera fabianii]
MSFTIPESNFSPVIIIGGGPSALAVSSRLCTTTSGAEYSDSEHNRFHWLRQRHNLDSSTGLFKPDDILILDKIAPRFMAQWGNQFEALGIKHLRSPMFFHPNPSDSDAMTAFAYANGREDELMEIKGVVGRDPFKHQKGGRRGSTVEVDQRNWTDFYRPGSQLFKDFCSFISKRARLNNQVKQCEVIDVKYGEICVVNEHDGRETKGIGFRVETVSGDVYGCGLCISAVGPSGTINYPIQPDLDYRFPQGSCHSSHLFLKQVSFPPPGVVGAIASKKAELIIVGGGLSSAQLAEKALMQGFSRVHFVTRGEIKVQHFDFGLEWVTKNKNITKTEFWQHETDEERFDAAMKARRGGSVNPQYLDVLHDLEKKGRVVIYRNTEVVDKLWDEENNRWARVTLHNKKDDTNTLLANMNYVVYCTGSTPSLTTEPFLQSLLESHPIKSVRGLPCLTDDLQWSKDVPFFMIGRYAMLRTGPSSANLDGGRLGVERVGWKAQRMREMGELFLGKISEAPNTKKGGMAELLRCTGGQCNWYGVLNDVSA